jgi:GT2 family glycosyltransferase
MFGLADHACKYFPGNHKGYFGRLAQVSSFSAVTAACLVIKKSLFEAVGGFDEENVPTDFNDVDFCLRIRALGFRNVYTPFAELYYFESATRGYDKTLNTPVGKYMQARWGDILNADPSYSAHLSLFYGDFSLAPQTRVAPVLPMKEGVHHDTIESVIE